MREGELDDIIKALSVKGGALNEDFRIFLMKRSAGRKR